MKKTVSLFMAVIFAALSFVGYSSAATATQNTVSVKSGGVAYADYDVHGNVLDSEFCRENFIPQKTSVFARTVSALPSAYSSVDEGHVTCVKDQGYANSCWAFSAISALESDSIIKGYTTPYQTDFSEAHLIWFSMNSYSTDSSDPSSGDGRTVDSAFEEGGNWRIPTAALARWAGVANESDYPFYPYDIDAMGNYPESDRYDQNSGVVLESAQVLTSANDVKQWIVDHGSVTVSYYHDFTYYNSATSAYCYPSASSINHMVAIVGWDDAFPADNFSSSATPAGDGAWLCKNSWGDFSKQGGYFWISYYDPTLTDFVGYTAKEYHEGDRNYTYNGADFYSYLSTTSRITAANIFTANGCEKLTAFSLYTRTSDTSVNYWVYTNLRSKTRPDSGTLVESGTLTVERAGYHTVELSDEYTLAAGSRFSVVYNCMDSTGNSYIPIEYDTATRTYTAYSGQSFVNQTAATGYNWIDTYSSGYGNCFIQAFTEAYHTDVTETVENNCLQVVYCNDCNAQISRAPAYTDKHSFGEWGEFKETATGEKVSTRVCSVCGATQTRSTTNNSITLTELLELIFERFFEALRLRIKQ